MLQEYKIMINKIVNDLLRCYTANLTLFMDAVLLNSISTSLQLQV